jgi:hypothetical protein
MLRAQGSENASAQNWTVDRSIFLQDQLDKAKAASARSHSGLGHKKNQRNACPSTRVGSRKCEKDYVSNAP